MIQKIFAAGTPLGPIGGSEGLGPWGKGVSIPGTTIVTAISAIIGFLTLVAAIWFLFQFVIGGISWITAGGDKTKLTEAREKLTNAFIGLIIVVAGWAILSLAGIFFGWTDITNPAKTLEKLQFK